MGEPAVEVGATKVQRARDYLLLLHRELAHGQAMPPERELAESLRVSRPTLRAAVAQLVTEGYLERRQGSGTFVTRPKVAQPLTLTSFSEDMERRGMRPGGRVLSFQAQLAGAGVSQRLNLSPRVQVWSVRRLRTADDEPMAIEQAYLPHDLVPDLKASNLSGQSLYQHLRDAGVYLGMGHQSIEPTVTSEDESELLRVPVLSPAFLFERVTNDSQGTPVEYVRSIYRGDRYQLLAELRPPFA